MMMVGVLRKLYYGKPSVFYLRKDVILITFKTLFTWTNCSSTLFVLERSCLEVYNIKMS